MKLYRNNEEKEDGMRFVRDGSFDELSIIAIGLNTDYIVCFQRDSVDCWSYGFYSSDAFYKLGEIKN